MSRQAPRHIYSSETYCAALWWVRVIRESASRWTLSRPGKPTEEQLDTLLTALYDSIEGMIEEYKAREQWHPDDPHRHGYNRIVGADYHPCPILSEGLKLAGIPTMWCPIKTWMHINPGEVRVQHESGHSEFPYMSSERWRALYRAEERERRKYE